MTEADFAAAIAGWHDFYLAVAGASAALLGLLFVGVSINLSSITGSERAGLRVLAEQAFANLVYVLVIALMLLVPDAESHGIGLGLAAIAALGLARIARNLRIVMRSGGGFRPLETLRRIGWTVVADVLIAFVAFVFFTTGDARVTVLLLAAVFVLLVGAADIAWRMLVWVTREASDQG